MNRFEKIRNGKYYVINCLIEPRDSEKSPLFNPTTAEARLDGYAIIPLEKYNKLVHITFCISNHHLSVMPAREVWSGSLDKY